MLRMPQEVTSASPQHMERPQGSALLRGAHLRLAAICALQRHVLQAQHQHCKADGVCTGFLWRQDAANACTTLSLFMDDLELGLLEFCRIDV